MTYGPGRAYVDGRGIGRIAMVGLMVVVFLLACAEQKDSWTVRLVNSQGTTIDLRVPLARTNAERAKGLSGLSELPTDGGMLFVFASEVRASFWMKDTLVPLSIAFIDGNGQIVDIQDMEPLSEDLHRPSADFKYALEMTQGYFARNDVHIGDHVTVRLDTR